MRAGDFSDPSLPRIYNPATLSGNTRQPFPNNKIPAAQFDKVAAAIQAYYPHPNLPGFANNYTYSQANVNPFIKEFGRIDYSVNDRKRVTFSITQRDNPAFYPNSVCPMNCQSGDVDSYNAQLSDVWTITPSTVNEFRFGYTRQWNWFVAQSAGLGYPHKLGLQFVK